MALLWRDSRGSGGEPSDYGTAGLVGAGFLRRCLVPYRSNILDPVSRAALSDLLGGHAAAHAGLFLA